eukprot:1089827-Prymnesium_polylepis.1
MDGEGQALRQEAHAAWRTSLVMGSLQLFLTYRAVGAGQRISLARRPVAPHQLDPRRALSALTSS